MFTHVHYHSALFQHPKTIDEFHGAHKICLEECFAHSCAGLTRTFYPDAIFPRYALLQDDLKDLGFPKGPRIKLLHEVQNLNFTPRA